MQLLARYNWPMSPDSSRPRPDARTVVLALVAVLVVGCSILAFVPQRNAPFSGAFLLAWLYCVGLGAGSAADL